MSSKIGFSEMIQVRCSSVKLWPMLGWQGYDKHPFEFSPEERPEPNDDPLRVTSLVTPTPWAYEHSLHDPSGAEAVWGRGMAGRVPIKFQLVCGE